MNNESLKTKITATTIIRITIIKNNNKNNNEATRQQTRWERSRGWRC